MTKFFRALNLSIMSFMCLVVSVSFIYSQTPSSTTIDNELKEVDLRAKKLALQEKEFDLLKKQIEATKASSTITSPNIEYAIMGTYSSNCLASSVAERLSTIVAGNATVILYDQKTPELLSGYNSLLAHLKAINKKYAETSDKAFPTIISGLAATAMLLKSDVSYAGATIDTGKNQFLASLLRASKGRITFILPEKDFTFESSSDFEIATQLNTLLRNYLEKKGNSEIQRAAEISLSRFGLILDEKTTKRDLDLSQLIKAETLLNKMKKAKKYYWLEITEVKSGSTVKISKGFFRSTFTPSRINMIAGGSLVSFILYDENGTIIDAGVLNHYSSFKKFSKLSTLTNHKNNQLPPCEVVRTL